MSSSIPLNTKKIPNRRQLRFDSLDAIAADVDQIAAWPAAPRSLGNWSPGQNLAHLAVVMTYSIDGFPARMPWIMRALIRLLIKRRLLTKPMTPGFRAPKNAKIMPGEVSFDNGLALIRTALARLKNETKRAPSPFLGPLTNAEWNQLHCRHAELHLSFIVPQK